MTDDRTLLERAAKASGLRVGFEPDGRERGHYDLFWSHVHQQFCWHKKQQGSEYPESVFWNPLTDDGDALRLGVKLLNWPHGGRAFDNAVTAMVAVGQLPPDPYAATRRAIVHAAAAMYKD